MKKALLASRRKRTISLVSHRAFCMIHANYGSPNWIPATALELNHLVSKVVDHAIDLLDHRLRKDFNFNPDFDSSYWPARHHITGVRDGRLAGDDFTERPVATPGFNAAALILNVQHPVLPMDRIINQLG